ncbi:MAG TPA: hypothetical protein VN025_20500 [Candidatus Dormibacteraeota bacterium]|jgi:hypothetical protein|nr:hypothetical protein [Candidatus Dormibacteraeota bacterium]
MNRWKICSAVLVLAIAAMCVPAANAQNIPLVGVGSSGFFGASALAAIKDDPIRTGNAPLCGTRFWTGTASAIDARKTLTTPNIPNEGGNIWIAWDNDAAPTVICAYLSVDSIVGQRLFFGTGASGNATLTLPLTACSTAPANKVSFVWDTATAGLPLAVYNALMGTTDTACPATQTQHGVHFNAAFTDIRPEDAQFVGNNRVLCNDANATASFPPDDKSCLGYGPGVTAPGTAVVSSYSTATAQAVAYSFTGTDPISGLPIPQAQTEPIGAQAALIFVNISNTASGGFGNLTSLGTNPLTNVNSHSLAALYSGQALLTRDIYGGPSGGIGVVAAHALVREPMSGTFTTFEWQVVRQRDGNTAFSQETGNLGPSQPGYPGTCGFVQSTTAFPPAANPCANPLNDVLGSSGALRSRVIGTGQMISIGNTTTLPDTIGYAFWSLGNFGNKQNIKYLTLDGSDALFPSYSVHNGVFPGGVAGQGTTALLPAPAAGQCGGYFNGDGGATITSFSCNAYTLPTFDGINSGNYRLWNVVRASYFGASALAPSFSPLNITGYVLGAQNQAAPAPTAVLPDFLPTTYCGDAACTTANLKHPVNVFRSHYALPAWGVGSPNNGLGASAENGGDVAGAIFNNQTEVDFNNIFSNSFLSWVQ